MGRESPPLTITAVALAMLFGTAWFATVALSTQLWGQKRIMSVVTRREPTPVVATTATDAHYNYHHHGPLNAQSLASVYALLYHTSLLGFWVAFVYVCEHCPPYPHAVVPTHDIDQFWSAVLLLGIVSLFTWQPNPTKELIQSSSLRDKTNGGHTFERRDENGSTNASGSVAYSQSWNNGHALDGTPLSSAMATAASIGSVSDDETWNVLNRYQTEEWKGWMQGVLLLYHYHCAAAAAAAADTTTTSSANSTPALYHPAAPPLSMLGYAYVWLTGFGHFTYFYQRRDYSVAPRVLRVLWRLGFLATVLSLTDGNVGNNRNRRVALYELYWFASGLPLCCFFMVYWSMRFAATRLNYSWWGLRLKLVVLAVIVYLVWDVDVRRLWSMGSSTPSAAAVASDKLSLWWLSSSYHWSAYWGMLFALHWPVTCWWFRTVEAQPLWLHVGAKAAVGLALCAGAAGCGGHVLRYPTTQAYYGIVPILAYVYGRNLTPWLRRHTLQLWHRLGQITLETYLLHHHVWLSSNGQTLLTLIVRNVIVGGDLPL
jgi:N-acetylneuraminate 9-O-acetyltransferase